MDNNSFLSTHRDYYMLAVEEAEAAFDLVSAKKPLFVRWVSDEESRPSKKTEAGSGPTLLCKLPRIRVEARAPTASRKPRRSGLDTDAW